MAAETVSEAWYLWAGALYRFRSAWSDIVAVQSSKGLLRCCSGVQKLLLRTSEMTDSKVPGSILFISQIGGQLRKLGRKGSVGTGLRLGAFGPLSGEEFEGIGNPGITVWPEVLHGQLYGTMPPLQMAMWN